MAVILLALILLVLIAGAAAVLGAIGMAVAAVAAALLIAWMLNVSVTVWLVLGVIVLGVGAVSATLMMRRDARDPNTVMAEQVWRLHEETILARYSHHDRDQAIRLREAGDGAALMKMVEEESVRHLSSRAGQAGSS